MNFMISKKVITPPASAIIIMTIHGLLIPLDLKKMRNNETKRTTAIVEEINNAIDRGERRFIKAQIYSLLP